MGASDGFTGDTVSSSSSWFSVLCSSASRAKSLAPTASGPAVRVGSGEALVRRLGLFDLILLGLGASIGSGIFVVTGTVARDVGPGVTISYMLAGASCIFNALCYAELASRLPAVVGGAYLYSYVAFNEITAFLVSVQLMFEGHFGCATISRSIASYVVALLELFPDFRNNIPSSFGNGIKLFGGALSINILAPIFVALVTIILCRGVKESSIVTSVMTTAKVIIVMIVILVGAFEVDVSNWSPFAPNGCNAILTGATVVFLSYVGFDAVANSAEESKRPQRDLPMGIIGCLVICIALYAAVCLVLTGMVPYSLINEDAPFSEAFASKGMKYVSVLISVGAIVGLTTTLLASLYVQSRLYLGLGRDGLLPSIFGKVHPTFHTPFNSQIWCGISAGSLAGLFNVRSLSHLLSAGTLTAYSVVAASVIAVRLKDNRTNLVSAGWRSSLQEHLICLPVIAFCGFGAGVFYRFGAPFIFLLITVSVPIVCSAILYHRQDYSQSPGSSFTCPGVPVIPSLCIFLNIFLFAQLHYEAWIRFVILSVLATLLYAFYGQHHTDPTSDRTSDYHRMREETGRFCPRKQTKTSVWRMKIGVFWRDC